MSLPANVHQLPRQRDGDLISIARELPLIEPGHYSLHFDRYETAKQFKACKVSLWFKIVTPGPAVGLLIPRHYNAQWVAGNKKRQGGGRFTFGACSAFYREFCAVFGAPSRRDRLSMSSFRNCVIRGEVGTVTEGHDQKPIPEGARYSVVRRLIELEAGRV